MLEPVGKLSFHGLSVGLGNFSLLDIDRVVLIQGGLVEDLGGDFMVKSCWTHVIRVGLDEASVWRGDLQGKLFA